MKALFFLLVLSGSVPSFREAVLFLTGASCYEELDSQVVEKYDALRSHPVDINSASRSKLLSSGLFTSFQVASLLDYRSRTGDILSFAELSVVDGFSSESAGALSYFIRLGTSSPPGSRPSASTCHDIQARTGYGSSTGFSISGKYSINMRDAVEAGVTSTGNFSVALHPRSLPVTFLVGDFNVRLGQGVAMWSGFSLNGFPTVSSFQRNGNGFSALRGYSDSGHRGVAAMLDRGRWSVGVCLSMPGLRSLMTGGKSELSYLPAAYVSYIVRRFSAGLSVHSLFASGYSSHTVSADFRAALRSVSLFGEAACNYKTDSGSASGAFCVGALWTPSYGRNFSVLGRFYAPSYHGLYSSPPSSFSGGSDEAGVSAGLSLPWIGCTADWSLHPSSGDSQLKAVCTVSKQFKILDRLSVTPSFRAVARYRPSESERVRTDLRSDISLALSDWTACFRYNTVLYSSASWMWYAELGWRKNFIRCSLFKVDDWQDRIYAYERSAPGNYSVPVFYGRGYRLSLYSSWRTGGGHSFYLCASYVAYPWNVKPKESRFAVQFQYSLSLSKFPERNGRCRRDVE